MKKMDFPYVNISPFCPMFFKYDVNVWIRKNRSEVGQFLKITRQRMPLDPNAPPKVAGKRGRPRNPVDPNAPVKIKYATKGRPPKPVDPNAPAKVAGKKGRPFKAPGDPKAPYSSRNPKRIITPIFDKPTKKAVLMNLEQVCQYLGSQKKPLCEKTIRTWIRTRSFPAHKVTPTNLRFVKSEVDKWTLNQ